MKERQQPRPQQKPPEFKDITIDLKTYERLRRYSGYKAIHSLELNRLMDVVDDKRVSVLRNRI
jgi:hypothetical protein